MYVVPRVPFIPQSQTWACWYASAEMLIQWKRETTLSTLAGHPAPSQIPELEAIQKANSGLQYAQVVRLAELLGLRSVRPQSATLAQIEQWLRQYGPLWTHGRKHIVVIAGADPASDRIFVSPERPVLT